MDRINTSKETTELIHQARTGIVTGMNHLNRAIGDFKDAMAPVVLALNRVMDAVSKMEEFASSTPEKQDAFNDKLENIHADIEPLRDSLALKQQQFFEGKPVELTRKELGQVIALVRKTTVSLDLLRLQFVASSRERIMFKWKRGASYSAWIVLISGLLAGFSIALTHPGYDEGLNAHYHNKPNFRGHRFECIDHAVDNNWGSGTPFKGIPRNRFSVRWEGCVKVDEGTERQIVAGADDRIRVILNGEMIIDDWTPHSYRLQFAEHILRPGVYPIEIKYQEEKGPARVFLGWKGLHEEVAPIPPENLLPRNVLIGGGGSNRECPKMPPLRNVRVSSKAASK